MVAEIHLAKNLKDGYLPKTSIGVYEKISVISSQLLIRKIGTLKIDIFKEIVNELSFLRTGRNASLV